MTGRRKARTYRAAYLAAKADLERRWTKPKESAPKGSPKTAAARRAENGRRASTARSRALTILGLRYAEECYDLYRDFRAEIDRERGRLP